MKAPGGEGVTEAPVVGTEWWHRPGNLASTLRFLVDRKEIDPSIDSVERFLREPWVWTKKFQDMRDGQLAIATGRS